MNSNGIGARMNVVTYNARFKYVQVSLAKEEKERSQVSHQYASTLSHFMVFGMLMIFSA